MDSSFAGGPSWPGPSIHHEEAAGLRGPCIRLLNRDRAGNNMTHAARRPELVDMEIGSVSHAPGELVVIHDETNVMDN